MPKVDLSKISSNIINFNNFQSEWEVQYKKQFNKGFDPSKDMGLLNSDWSEYQKLSTTSSGAAAAAAGSTTPPGPTPPKEGLFTKFLKGSADFVKSSAETQIVQGAPGGKQYLAIEALENIKNKGVGLETIFDAVKGALDEVGEQLKAQSQLQSDINSKTTLTGKLSKDLRGDIENASIKATEFGISMSELGELYIGLVQNSGKFSLINQETLEKAAPTVRAFADNMASFANTLTEFEKVGMGVNQTIDLIGKAGTKSMSLGLSGKKVVSDITTNIGKLNEYGFSKGVDGLKNMVQKSLEFRMNMESVFSIADKVMNPEGALDLVANLQVLGGAIGDLGDPLKLMYDATNNVEGIQDALIGAAGSLATYSREQGRFEITGLNLRRAKEMAAQLGISYQELAKGAISAAERSSAASAMLRSGIQVSEEDKRFLTNLSSMEGGEMVIKIPKSIAEELGVPTKVALDKLDQKVANALIQNAKDFAEMSPEDVAREQLTTTEKIMRDLEVIAQYFRVQAVKLIGGKAEEFGLKDMYTNLEKTLKGYKKDLTEGGGDDIVSKLNNIDNSTKQSADITKSQNNPGNVRVVLSGLYEKAKNDFETSVEDGTKEGSKQTSETLKINVQETKDLNTNYKSSVEKQDIVSKSQIDNQRKTSDSINSVATNVIESGKNVTENISETTENNNKLFTTLKTETNKVGTTENLDKINTNFSSVINDILVKKETKESNLIEGKTSNFENLVSLVTNTSKNISDNLNKNTSEIFTKSVENKNEFSDVNKQFTQLFTRKDEIVTSKESTKEDFQNYFQNFRTSLEENKTNVSQLITNEKNKKTEQVEYNESINKTLKNQAVTVEENILPKNTIQTENVITPKQIVGRPTETLNTPNVINATTEPLISGRNEIIEKTIEKEPVTTTETNKGESKPSTVTIVHKHEFGTVQPLLDPLQREMFRNPELYQTDINKRDYRSQEIVLST